MVTRTLTAPALARLLDGRIAAEGPAYRALAEAVRRLVVDGRVLPGTRLPSERDLTAPLGLSRTTVTAAYGLLREEGYLSSRRGSGSFVELPFVGIDRGGALWPGSSGPDDGDVVDLAVAAPPAPPGTAAAYEKAAVAVGHYLHGSGYEPHGLPELRASIAERYAERGLPTDPGQIVVTAGALAGLGVVTRAVLRPGERVLMESPTYPNAIAALRRSGARLVAAPFAPGGWDLDGIAALTRQSSPSLAYLVLDNHNPTGRTLPDAGRARLAATLRRGRATTVVDETMAELTLDGDPAAPYPAFDDSAFLVGGMSKTYWGGLRLGWVRAPHDAVAGLLEARIAHDLGVPVVEQLVAIELLAQGADQRERRRAGLLEGRETLLAALAEHLPEWRTTSPAGGLALWVRLPHPHARALASVAPAHGVRVVPGSRFAVEGSLDGYVRLSYCGDPARLRTGVERLAGAWADVLAGGGASAEDADFVA